MNYLVTVNGTVVQTCYCQIVADCWVTFYAVSMGVKAEVVLVGQSI